MVAAGPVVDPRWWVAESYRGVALREYLANRDFGPIFGFLKARGWSVGAIAAVTRVQEARVREIMAGRRRVTSYEVIERIVTGLSIDRGLCGIGTETSTECRCQTPSPPTDSIGELMERAGDLGPEALAALMAHTDHIRDLTHTLGNRPAMTALAAHLSILSSLRAFSVDDWRRRQLANVFHDASCLAAGLCLRLGEDTAAWRHHEAAKDAARESRCAAAIAHTLRRQAELLAEHGQLARRSRLLRAVSELSEVELPDVSRAADPMHYHGRLYQGIATQPVDVFASDASPAVM